MTHEPMAWLAFSTDGSESSAVYLSQEQAQAAADEWGWSLAPLYRQPQPILTDEEREAIERLAIHCADTSCVDTARTLWGLLERLDRRS